MIFLVDGGFVEVAGFHRWAPAAAPSKSTAECALDSRCCLVSAARSALCSVFIVWRMTRKIKRQRKADLTNHILRLRAPKEVRVGVDVLETHLTQDAGNLFVIVRQGWALCLCN